jgi:hypothetical protein
MNRHSIATPARCLFGASAAVRTMGARLLWADQMGFGAVQPDPGERDASS